MPNQTGAALSGAASGASAGAAFGPWGAAIGGVLGAAGGLMNAPGLPPRPTQLAGPTTPGAGMGQYGGTWYDPTTGMTTNAGFNTNFQNYITGLDLQSLWDQFMGNQDRTGFMLSQQAKQIQDEITRLSEGSSAKALDISKYVDKSWLDPKTGELYKDNAFGFGHPNNVPRTHPIFQEFMRDSGGKYGSDNVDISFGKWLKDVVEKNVIPQYNKYKKDKDTKVGSDEVRTKAIQDLQQRLGFIQNEQKARGIDPTTGEQTGAVKENPLMAQLRQQDRMAGSYEQAANARVAREFEQQNKIRDMQMAKRGMLNSSVNEIGRAGQVGQLADMYAQNKYNASQIQNNVLQQKLGFMNQLQGMGGNVQNNTLALQGFGSNQAGQMFGVGQGMASRWDDVNAANNQMQNAFVNSGYQQQLMNGQQNQNALIQGIGGVAQGLNAYYGSQNKTPFTSGYMSGLKSGGIQPVPVSGGNAIQADTISTMPKRWGS
jgi:hypothetical protein